jgi:SAM-dependent methyltransferase
VSPEKFDREVDAIRGRYARRSDDLMAKSVFLRHRQATSLEKQAAIIDLLRVNLCMPLSEVRILEIGCGYGDNLLQFVLWGARPENLTGNELLEERAMYARSVLPAGTQILLGDARVVNLAPASFDVVMASTVFSSILDLRFRAALAAHLWSLVRPGGGVLWYDFAYDNPRNPDVRKVTLRDLARLFPEAKLDVRRLTLAPPIARRLAPLSPLLYRCASAMPFLRTHLIGWLGKARIPR